MSLHIAATYLASAPARIGLAVVAAFAALLAVLLATTTKHGDGRGSFGNERDVAGFARQSRNA